MVYHSNLEEFEKESGPRYPFFLSYREVKLLGIAGVRIGSSVVTRPTIHLFHSLPVGRILLGW